MRRTVLCVGVLICTGCGWDAEPPRPAPDRDGWVLLGPDEESSTPDGLGVTASALAAQEAVSVLDLLATFSINLSTLYGNVRRTCPTRLWGPAGRYMVLVHTGSGAYCRYDSVAYKCQLGPVIHTSRDTGPLTRDGVEGFEYTAQVGLRRLYSRSEVDSMVAGARRDLPRVQVSSACR